jgi:hypothetical protein
MKSTRLNTRTRITIVSIATGLFYLLLGGIDLNKLLGIAAATRIDLFKALILGIFIYAGTLWALFFKVKGERYLTLVSFPAIGVIALSLLIELILVNIISGIGQVALYGLSFIFLSLYSYISLLTVNILNTSHEENIPLAQAARASLFILALIDAYLIFFMTYSNDLNIFIRLLVILGISILLSYITLWSIELKVNDRINVALAVGLILTYIAAILSIWPLQPPYLALALSMFFYIFMNIAMEIRELIGRWIWIEYIVLFLLVITMLLVLPEWGINGPLI